MINLNKIQKQCMRDLGICKVKYKNIWRTRRELGYTSKGKRHYDISIASDTGSWDVSDIVLVHEVGHVWLEHMEVNLRKEVSFIQDLMEKRGLKLSHLRKFGGPINFINICMDLEVNSKLLTFSNLRTMTDFGVTLCTPDVYKVPILDNFRDYYEPLFDKIEKDNEGTDNLPDFSQDDSSPSKSNGKGSAVPNGFQQDLPDINGDGDESSDENENSEKSEEIEKELEKENYKFGDSKDERERSYYESSVEDEEENMGASNDYRDEDKTSKVNKYWGSSSATDKEADIYPNNKDTLKKFLNNIINVNKEYEYDSLKHYNRGTRKNESNLLYSSMKRKRKPAKKKLAILIDVSGSMYTDSIVEALGSLKNVLDVVDNSSIVMTCNERPQEEFPITKIPSKVRLGGGTNIAAGLRVLAKRGYTDIVIYSDFETKITDMVNVIDQYKIKVYSIFVDSTWQDLKSQIGGEDYIKKTKNKINVER